MNCPEVMTRIQAQLDGESLPADPVELQAHLRTCATCRELYQATLRLCQGLPRPVEHTPPAGFADAVVSRVLGERQQVFRFRRWVVGVAAAVVLGGLAIWLAVGLLSPTSEPPPFVELPPGKAGPGAETKWLQAQVERAPKAISGLTSLVTQEVPRVAFGSIKNAGPTVVAQFSDWAATRRSPPSWRAQLREVPGAMVGLTRHVTQDAAVLVPSAPAWTTPELPPLIEPTADSMRDVGRTVSGGLEPVTNSFRRASDKFLRVLPTLEEDKPG